MPRQPINLGHLSPDDLLRVIKEDRAASLDRINSIHEKMKEMSPEMARSFADAIGRVASDGGCGSFGCC